ncbi:hypothetical protein V7654_23860 [Bacillus sp. JJ1609]
MGYFLIAVVLLVVFYSVFKIIKKGKLPSNEYTPFDDLTEGKSDKD